MKKILVDISKLVLDTSKLDNSFIAYETDLAAINALEHNDVINDWHIERIRRLNATAGYLILSLQRLQISGDTLSKMDEPLDDPDKYYALVGTHRASCRDVCINLDIYTEGIKSFCRYYFFMDKEATDNTKEWRKALVQYKGISGWTYIENFLLACRSMFENKDTKLLTAIRNEEVHNASPLELITYKFQDKALIPIPTEYILTNQELHNKIVNVINLLLIVTSALQEVINNISPIVIYKYLSPQDGRLKNIINMADRYKKEREYVKQFQENMESSI